MNDSSQRILKKVLLEYMETEAAQVPSTEELMCEHTFSKQFLTKMTLLLTWKETTAQRKISEIMTEHDENEGKTGLFRRIVQNRISFRVTAACLVCVIVFGAGWMIYRGGGGLKSSDSEEAAVEETTDAAEESAAAGNSEDADQQDEAVSDALDGGDTQDDSDAAQNEILLTAQAETDLAGLSVAVNSCTAYSMELELTNDTGIEIICGSYYTVERYDDTSDTWVTAEQMYDGVFDDLACTVQDGETVTVSVDWSNLYGELDEGIWRLTREVRSTGDEGVYTLTVMFEI